MNGGATCLCSMHHLMFSASRVTPQILLGQIVRGFNSEVFKVSSKLTLFGGKSRCKDGAHPPF